jgi:hypothetical protein
MRPPARANPMVLAMSTSVASELESIESCTSTRIPVETHSLLPASDSPSASRVDSSIGSAVVVVVVVVLALFLQEKKVPAVSTGSSWNSKYVYSGE